MEEITATFRVVTPMFMSGADQSKAELRLPSIKGALRFWWRAQAWGRLNGDLNAIREEEANLFGSTDKGQAAVLMKLVSDSVPEPLKKDEMLKDKGRVIGDGARYLGYGVVEAFRSKKKGTEAGQLVRPCLPAPFNFKVAFRFKPRASERQQTDNLTEAIKLMGLIGCIGSKSRKGYGSLTLTRLEHGDETWNAPNNVDELSASLADFQSESRLPEFTAPSKHTRFLVLTGNEDDSPLSLLDRVGREVVFYRSWGNKGKVLGTPREENFKEDHDLMKGLKTNIEYPRRVVFGLPHNYGQKRDQQVTPGSKDRRASPLFIHVHQASKESQPLAVVGFLPAAFLPEKESLKLLNTRVEPSYDEAFWQPIHDFLERLKGTQQQPPSKRREKFGKVLEVGE